MIFLIAINEYDLKLVEDESVNRMHESMQLWSDICKEKWLKHIPIIVFLNKSDLFKEKIAKLDMSCCFPEYTGMFQFIIVLIKKVAAIMIMALNSWKTK